MAKPGPEYSAELLDQIYRTIYHDRVLPHLERYATQPVPEDVTVAITRWMRQSRISLPDAVARAVRFEADFVEKAYEGDCQALQIPMPPLELRPSTLFAYGSGCVQLAEDQLRFGGVIERALQESIASYGEQTILAGDTLDTKAAEGHIITNRWVQELMKDPSGFSLVDKIASGELPSQLAPSIIKPREIPYVRVIELGAKRYKSFYRQAFTSVPNAPAPK